MPNNEYTEENEFSINPLIEVPCDSVFLNLLNQKINLKRPYDKTEAVKNVNDFGEIVMTYPNAQIIGTDIPVRIDAISQRGQTGFVVRIRGGEVLF